MGVPFMPVRGILGSDYLKVQPRFKVIRSPFTGHEIVVVEAINPDYTVIHASKADSRGNVLIQRQSDVDLAVEASQVAIATVEEIIKEGELAPDENSRLMSWINFHVIVHAPYGAHPTGCQGQYPVDSEHVKRYIKMAESKDLFETYLQKYVLSPAEGAGYVKLVTDEGWTPLLKNDGGEP
jgi:glutaconate CoA-transferase, subunit A